MKDLEHDNQEIRWSTISKYVDLDTGEQLTQKEANNNYLIIKKKKHATIYKSTGTTTITNECRRTTQTELF